MNTFNIIGKTFAGLEEPLANELKKLGIDNIEILRRGIQFKGSLETLYLVNYESRLALRFLKNIFNFKASNEATLYKNIYNFPWESVFSIQDTFAITSTISSKFFNHSKYVALKSKDAIVDRFRNKFNKRPDINKETPDIIIHIHINHDVCDVSLDSSGEPLYKRGYRVGLGEAPLNEVLAAGLINLSGWNKTDCLVDFTCGSGTILIEAALLAYNIAPGSFRKNFGFENWKDFDTTIYNKIITNKNHYTETNKPEIIGCDISPEVIQIANKNIENAKLKNKIKVQVQSFKTFVPTASKGILISNPPYGERIKPENLFLLYKEMGDALKANFNNYDAWIFSHNKEALKQIGLKTSKKTTLYNGQLECKYNKYQIFKGSFKK